MKKTVKNLCVIAGAITYGFATVGKVNVQKNVAFCDRTFADGLFLPTEFSAHARPDFKHHRRA